jgi:hypothetical protein
MTTTKTSTSKTTAAAAPTKPTANVTTCHHEAGKEERAQRLAANAHAAQLPAPRQPEGRMCRREQPLGQCVHTSQKNGFSCAAAATRLRQQSHRNRSVATGLLHTQVSLEKAPQREGEHVLVGVLGVHAVANEN